MRQIAVGEALALRLANAAAVIARLSPIITGWVALLPNRGFRPRLQQAGCARVAVGLGMGQGYSPERVAALGR